MIFRTLGYVGFFMVAYVLCLYLTFPWGAVKQRVLQQASKQAGRTISATKLEPSWLTGVHAEGVEVEMDEGEPLKLRTLDARASVLSFVTGGYGGTVWAPIAKGQLTSTFSGGGDVLDIDAKAEKVELALLPALKSATGLALGGRLNLDADIKYGVKDPKTTSGLIELQASGLETLKGGRAGNYPIPELELGNLDWSIPIENGKVIVRNQRIEGPSLELILDGEIVLNKPTPRSLLNLTVQFKPTPEFLEAEPLIASLLRNIDRYKNKSGFYTYQISGTLKRPRTTPKRS